MPIPKPKRGEPKNDFISRCMANGVMNSEYPDSKQRAAVCNTSWNEKKFNAEGETMDLEVEVFAVGTWNGMPFEKTDLMGIANAFNSLKEVHDVPLKFGHNKEQEMTDGLPALGWVGELFIKGEKLMAKFVDMPKIVHDAMKKKLYKHVSIELEYGVEHKGSIYDLVLSGVALLGADIPAVNTIADLTSYMSKDPLAFKKRVAFTAINIKHTEEFTMNELEKAQAEVAALKAKNEAQGDQIKDFTKDKVDSESKIAEFEAKDTKRAEDEKTAYFAKAKTDMTSKLEQMVKDEIITPAQREKFTAEYSDDKSVIERLEFTLGILSDGAKGTKGMDKNEHGKENMDNEDEDGKLPDEILMTRVNVLLEKDTSLNFTSARNRVMKADPKLAKAYRDMNDQ